MDTATAGYGRIFKPKAFLEEESWHATARELRRDHPLLRVESEGWPSFWALTRYEDIMEIERRPDVWLNTRKVFFQPDAQSEAQTSGTDMRMIIQMDDPEHKVYRDITSEWFRPATLRRTMEGRVGELAKQFVDRMAAFGGSCDFAADVAKLYPLHVIMSILGVPESDTPRMLTLTQELLGPADSELRRDSKDSNQGLVETILDFFQYFKALSAARRDEPTGDVASTIANATIDGEPLGDIEAMSYYVILATAGHDTTSSALAGGMEALIRHPDALRRLQSEPGLIPNAVDEMIRWCSPVKQFLRTACEEYELHGQRIPAGDHALLSFASANFDETVFADPFTFDVTRPNADRHLAFGFGKHFCLGAQLARMELRAFFAELLPRLSRIEISGDCPRVEANIVSGFKHLPVTFSMT